MVTVFNDREPNLASTLEHNIHKLPGVSTLSFTAQVLNYEVDNSIFGHIRDIRNLPTLFFHRSIRIQGREPRLDRKC